MRLLLSCLATTILLHASSLDESRNILVAASQNKEGDTRREAAVALSLVPARDPASKLLNTLLSDKDYLVRVAAIESLGELNDKSRLDALKKALNDDVPEVGFAAAKALFALKAPEGREAMEAIFHGEMKAKSSFFKKEMMNTMRRLKTPKSAMLFAVQRGIGFVPVPGLGAGYGALAGILSDADLSVRAVSLLAVCQEKSRECDGMYEQAFRDDDWSVRAAALHLATQRNSPRALPLVAPLLADKKDRVQFRAAAVYLRLDRPRPFAKKSSR